MKREYTAEESAAWRASQPQKMIVVKVIIKSDSGTVLLLKSSYKKSWQFPGGGVNNSESPEAAAVREVHEETGLIISPSDLVIKGTIYKQDEEMLFIIYESKKLIHDNALIKLQQSEVVDFKFTEVASVPSLLSDYYADFWDQNYLLKVTR